MHASSEKKNLPDKPKSGEIMVSFPLSFQTSKVAPAITQSTIPLIGAAGSTDEYPIKFHGLPSAGTNVEIPTTTKTAMTSQ
jgi:hypothetical protein